MLTVTLLDGGMGRELAARGVSTRSKLWSAQALLDAPETVVEVHREFAAAGARILTTNSYSCVPSYLGKAGHEDRFAELAALSGRLAREAADRSPAEVLVAGSLPPLDESYRWDLVPPDDIAQPIYAKLAEALEPYCDLFLCETMSSIRESCNAVRAAKAAAAKRDLPVFVAWSLKETSGSGLRSGETIADAVGETAPLQVDAYLFNCTHPDAIEAAIAEIAQLTDKPFGGYANHFDIPEGFTLDGNLRVRERDWFTTSAFVKSSMRCVGLGATIVGGCCGIGPRQIAALSERLSARDLAKRVGVSEPD